MSAGRPLPGDIELPEGWPECGCSACWQNWIDTGESACIADLED